MSEKYISEYRNAFKTQFKYWLEDIDYKMIIEKGTPVTAEQKNEIVNLVNHSEFNHTAYVRMKNLGYSSEFINDALVDWTYRDACTVIKEEPKPKRKLKKFAKIEM